MASDKKNPDSISKEAFKKKLDAARHRAGSVFKLAVILDYSPRRIQKWLKGEGPSYPKMQALYFKLDEV